MFPENLVKIRQAGGGWGEKVNIETALIKADQLEVSRPLVYRRAM